MGEQDALAAAAMAGSSFDPRVRVRSAFGGIAIYKPEALYPLHYEGYECEHVCLHRRMQDVFMSYKLCPLMVDGMTVNVAYINLRAVPIETRSSSGTIAPSSIPRRFPGAAPTASMALSLDCAEGLVARDHCPARTPEGYEPHTWGHLGAALSHRSLWEQAARSGDDDVLVILEDDAQVCPQFGARLRRVLESANNGSPGISCTSGFNTDAPLTIQLDYPRLEVQLICQENGRPIGQGAPFAVSWPEKPYEGETLLARVIDIHGICGYAVSAHGARRLLEVCFPMTATSIDGTISRKTREGMLQALIAIPPLVLSPNDHADSDTVRSACRIQRIAMTDNRYYAEQFPLAIYDSKPIPCGDTRGYEVHILTCERDRTMAFWALKSFYYHLGERPPLVVHDDGSLTPESFRLFYDHFPGCTVVPADHADADSRLRETLKLSAPV